MIDTLTRTKVYMPLELGSRSPVDELKSYDLMGLPKVEIKSRCASHNTKTVENHHIVLQYDQEQCITSLCNEKH